MGPVERNKETSNVQRGANEIQVGGEHYRTSGDEIQHWDFAALRGYDYFQGAATKYIDRWREKNGAEDIRKAIHYLQKYLELIEEGKIK